MRALDRFENVQGLAEMRDGTTGVAEGPAGESKIVQRIALAAPVADLPRNR